MPVPHLLSLQDGPSRLVVPGLLVESGGGGSG